jgi:hypothetical protein
MHSVRIYHGHDNRRPPDGINICIRLDYKRSAPLEPVFPFYRNVAGPGSFVQGYHQKEGFPEGTPMVQPPD